MAANDHGGLVATIRSTPLLQRLRHAALSRAARGREGGQSQTPKRLRTIALQFVIDVV